MISKDSLKLYNAYYYAHSLGEPYARTPRWMEFFSRVANRIVSDIAPTTVLDAGCALGMLVETLRGRGIQAWGFDISRFAIRSAHPNAKKYLWVGSIVDPLPHTFDLIVCVEVLEHLPKADSERALANLCAHTGDILFSSTPVDYKEATHFNVQQPEYWAALFARQGFYRDVDFDGTIITPWAARFRRRKDPAHRLIRDYERKYWPLWKENYDLRSATLEGQQELSATHDQIRMLQEERRSKDRAIKTLWAGIEKRDQQIKDLQQRAHQANIQLKTLQGQRLHRWADRIYAGYNRLFPPDSAPARLVERVLGGYRTLRTRGPRAALRAWHPPQAVPHLTPSKYAAWYSKHEPDPAALQAQRAEAGNFTYQPVISFITPVYNPPPNVLRATIESVLAQTYPHWELCLADGGSPNPDVQLILERYAVQDQRIRVKFLDENLGISGNTNAALELAQGEFVAILDHDDTLAPHMLYEVVGALKREPDTDWLYFDEDKLSQNGKTRHNPFFKPSWSPEMLLSANYLMHSVIRRAVVHEVGGFDPATDGAQDWDLAFRVTAQTDRIVHIPKVLYHWRQAAGSTAAQLDAKSWAFETQLDSVERHLRRQGLVGARALYPRLGYLRVVWPTRGDKVSVIIPTKDNPDVLKTCLHSIFRKTTYPNFEIVLVDSGSTDPDTLAFYQVLERDPRVKIVPYETNSQFVYSRANNLGVAQAGGAFLLFLNNDTEVIEPDWMEEMVRWAERPEIGVVGAKLLYPDNTVQHAGVVLGMRGHGGHVFKGVPERFSGPFGSVEWYRNYMAVTAACMMMRREVFDQAGGFDEEYVLAFNDIDLCVQVTKLGYRNLYTPHARLYHHEGKSRGGRVPAADILHACDRLETVIARGDPYFNPNLSPNQRAPILSQSDDISPAEHMVRMRRDALAAGKDWVFDLDPRS